jgi:hypothetical protein
MLLLRTISRASFLGIRRSSRAFKSYQTEISLSHCVTPFRTILTVELRDMITDPLLKIHFKNSLAQVSPSLTVGNLFLLNKLVEYNPIFRDASHDGELFLSGQDVLTPADTDNYH